MLDTDDTLVILADVLGEEKSTNCALKCAEKTRHVFLVSSSQDMSASKARKPSHISYSEFVALCTELSPIQTWY